ncbi:PAS domain-containing protein [Cytophagaceae bacterium ABcell3]|nr:PAS domain-containing protein [Cytophagaceae bacterium ABcell3]
MKFLEHSKVDKSLFFDALLGKSKENSLLLLDHKGRILECNSAFFNAYGYKPEDLKGKHFEILFSEEDRRNNRPFHELDKAVQEGSASDNNYLLHKSGYPVWTQGEILLAKDPDGNIFFIKNIVDINDQKILEQYVEESQLAEAILEKLRDPVVVIDDQLDIVKANAAFYSDFSINNSENSFLKVLRGLKRYNDGNGDEIENLLVGDFQDHFSFKNFEMCYKFPDKGIRVVSVVVSKVDFEKDSLRRVILFFKDITKEKEEREALQRSISFSQNVLETLPLIAYTTDSSGEIVYFNNQWREYTGQSIGEGKGRGWLEMLHPDDVDLAIKNTKDAVDNHKEVEVELRLFNVNYKSYRWNISRIRPVSNGEENIDLWVGTIIDVHDERSATLDEIKSLQNILLDSQKLGNVGSFNMDLQANSITWSPQTYQIYGIDLDQEISFEDVFMRVHPKDKERLRNKMREAIENNIPYEIEYDILFPNNCVKKVLARGKIRYDENGNPKSLNGSLIDITKRKRREERLQNMQTLLLESQALSHTGSFEWNLINNKVKWTPELYAICGIPQGEKITFETHSRYIHPEDFPAIKRLFDEAYIKPGPFQNEFRIIRADNTERFISSKSKVIFDRDNKPVRVLGALHDLTERKKIEEKLSRANYELERKVKERTVELLHANEELKKANADSNTFVYTASHDLKAPINNIEGLVGALREELKAEDSSKEGLMAVLDMMDLAVEKFKKNLQDLAAIGQAQAEGKLNESCIKFEDVFHDVEADLIDLIARSSAKISYDFSRVPKVLMSPKNLRSIFYNFLSNAIKYKSPDRDPVVEVFTDHVKEGYTLLSIKDNGLGIREEDKDRLFAMYKRIHEHVQGSGVGLAIVKRIIENNGGYIEVKSKVGEGTTFNIFIKK